MLRLVLVLLAHAVARLVLAAATLGFGAAGFLVIAHHRWPALIGLVLWAAVGREAFLTIWHETDRSSSDRDPGTVR